MIQQLISLTSLSRLRIRWIVATFFYMLFLLIGYHFLAAQWQVSFARQWLVQAGAGCIYILWVLWQGLEHNHRIGSSRLLPVFGAGNVMTLLRGALVAALLGFLLQPWLQGRLAWIPAVLYTLAGLADFLDGYLARITNHATRMGELLDMNIDGLGVLAASLLAVQYGQVPVWYLLVALARYLFLAGIWLRKRLGKPIYELQPSIRRRAFAGVQMGFLFFILMPIFSPPGTYIAAVLFALPFLVGFLIDWLAVSGVIKPRSAGRQASDHLRSIHKSFILNWLPVGLRLLAAIFMAGQLVQFLAVSSGLGGIEPGSELLPSRPDLFMLVLAQGLVLIFLTVGAGGRIASIAGLCLLGIQQLFASLTPIQIVLAVLFTAILYLGTGSLSLWKPEERLIFHRAGEQPS